MDLNTALTKAHDEYTQQNPKSLARHQTALDVMPGGNTRSVLFNLPFPLGVAKAESCKIYDLDGHEYIDFLGEYTAGIYGHSHPVIRAAIDKALDNGLNFGGTNETEVKLAQAICERFPSIDRIRFTNSGTEANLMAITAARRHTNRSHILVFAGAYHGGVLYFSTGKKNPVNAPYDFVLAPYNDVDATRALIQEHSANLAAVLLEPMMGSGGCIQASTSFLQMLRDECTQHQIVLIFDEVMTSRLAPGGFQEAVGVLPDMTTLGKYIGGGMSFGAFGGRVELMDHYNPHLPDALPHAGTFNNNVLTMNAGLAGLTQVYTPDAARKLNEQGEDLRRRLNQLCQRAEAPMQFTGRGSMMTVHMTDAPIHSPTDAAKGNQALRELFFFDMVNSGIWLAPRGMINLSLPHNESQLNDLVDAVGAFVEQRECFL
ncbi:MAG: aspartate aminotransferase family protein [Chloroflexota bacterium]